MRQYFIDIDTLNQYTPELEHHHESGPNLPLAEKLIRLADALATTADNLSTGNLTADNPLANNRLVRRFRALEQFNDDDRETIITLIDAMIEKQQLQSPCKLLMMLPTVKGWTPCKPLNKMPDTGKMVPETGNPNIKELGIYSYRLIYEIKPNGTYVLAVVHKRRDFKAENLP